MDTIKYSKARQNLASLLDQVSGNRAPVEILRRDKPSAILLDKDDYDRMVETLYLVASPQNAKRLNESIRELDAGGGKPQKLASDRGN